MRTLCLGVAVLLAVAPTGPVWGAGNNETIFIPPNAAGEQDAPESGLVEVFARFCLDWFPPQGRVEDGAPGLMTALSPD